MRQDGAGMTGPHEGARLDSNCKVTLASTLGCFDEGKMEWRGEAAWVNMARGGPGTLSRARGSLALA